MGSWWRWTHTFAPAAVRLQPRGDGVVMVRLLRVRGFGTVGTGSSPRRSRLLSGWLLQPRLLQPPQHKTIVPRPNHPRRGAKRDWPDHRRIQLVFSQNRNRPVASQYRVSSLLSRSIYYLASTRKTLLQTPDLRAADPERGAAVERAAHAPVDEERVARQRRNESAEQNVTKSI